MISSKTLYLTEDRGTVVNEGDPKAKFLLVRAGQEINDALAEQYGIAGDKAAAPGPQDHPKAKKSAK